MRLLQRRRIEPRFLDCLIYFLISYNMLDLRPALYFRLAFTTSTTTTNQDLLNGVLEIMRYCTSAESNGAAMPSKQSAIPHRLLQSERVCRTCERYYGLMAAEELTAGSSVVCLFVCLWRNSPQWARAPSFTRFLDHTQRRTTVGRTPLDE